MMSSINEVFSIYKQVLIDVCNKHKLDVADYDLMFHQSIIDLDLAFKYSGIPNNALVEMVPATKQRKQQPINVCVQLASGDRFMGNFQPDQTVWDVLQTLCPSQSNIDTNPIVIYLSINIYGIQQFQATTLRSLGLTGGTAVFRLDHRDPADMGTQANVSKPLPIRPVVSTSSADETMEVVISTNVMDQGQQQINISKDGYGEKDNMSKEGYDEKDNMSKDGYGEKDNIFKDGYAEKDNMSKEGYAEKDNMVEDDVPLAELKMQDNIIFINSERDAILFWMNSVKQDHKELPDDFFDLTVHDVRLLFNDLRKKREELEDQPLLTSSYKEIVQSSNILRNLQIYKKTLIRIQFPDRSVLQAVFRSVETVADVHTFLNELLADRNLPFFLYTVPPKNVIDVNLTLLEADCVPNMLLFFGTNNTISEGYRFLKAEYYEKFSTFSSMKLFFDKIRADKSIQDMPSTSTNK